MTRQPEAPRHVVASAAEADTVVRRLVRDGWHAQDGFALVRVVTTMAFGALFGLVWALVGYQVTGGNRDFMSISQVVATRYEVLTEHKHAARARELLTEMDPMRAAQEQAQRAREAAVRAATQGTEPRTTREPS